MTYAVKGHPCRGPSSGLGGAGGAFFLIFSKSHLAAHLHLTAHLGNRQVHYMPVPSTDSGVEG